MTEVYPAVHSIVCEGIASERKICEFLTVSRSAFQRWRRFETSPREDEDRTLLPMIISIFHRHCRRYGTRRIVDELADREIYCSRRRVAKLLKIAGLKAIQPKSFKPRTTESKHSLGYSPNLILDLAEPHRANQLWVGDITYIPTVGLGFSYLATLMDRFSRMIVGWSLRTDMTEELVLTTLRQAISNRQPPAELIHHTDRGGQYAGTRYRGVLQRAMMQQSMSRAGDCYDNAFMESCFGTFKTELEMTERNVSTIVRHFLLAFACAFRLRV
ncbi:MAG: IS3 family transposase [Pirellulaceae bacterium]